MGKNEREVDPAALEHVKEASISAGRKCQLEKYEPINEQATLTVEFPDDATVSEKKAMLEDAAGAAWDQCERDVQLRYEQHVKQEAFGDD
jgi:hypothetical protein